MSTEQTVDDVMTLGIRDGIFHIGDRPYPWAELDNNDLPMLPGQKWRERRARFHFESGWTLSVVFGDGTYSTNHDAGFAERHPEHFKGAEPFSEEVRSAEVGVWRGEGGLLEWPSGDSVEGYVPARVVARLIEEMKDWPSAEVDLPDLDDWR